MEDLIIKVETDIEVNKRCLEENNIHPYVIELLELWIKYDAELLAIIKREKIMGVK